VLRGAGGPACQPTRRGVAAAFLTKLMFTILSLTGGTAPSVRALDFGINERNAVPVHHVNLFGGLPGVRCRRSQRTGAKLVALVVESSGTNTKHIHQSRATT
jgi:hypothetical protein